MLTSITCCQHIHIIEKERYTHIPLRNWAWFQVVIQLFGNFLLQSLSDLNEIWYMTCIEVYGRIEKKNQVNVTSFRDFTIRRRLGFLRKYVCKLQKRIEIYHKVDVEFPLWFWSKFPFFWYLGHLDLIFWAFFTLCQNSDLQVM